MDERSAAYHESAHAVIAVKLGLPLQDTGIRLDTIDGGITFNLHRKAGDPRNLPADIEERERSIVMIKAGFTANLKLVPTTPTAVASNDRQEEIQLLDEMYPTGGQTWRDADKRLTKKAQDLVDQNWDAISALAQAILGKPVVPRSPASFQRWCSPHPNERFMNGYEVAAILKQFGLDAIVRKESDGICFPPDTRG